MEPLRAWTLTLLPRQRAQHQLRMGSLQVLLRHQLPQPSPKAGVAMLCLDLSRKESSKGMRSWDAHQVVAFLTS